MGAVGAYSREALSALSSLFGMSYVLKQCHIHIVLVQLYLEPGNDFNVLFVYSFLTPL